ncbi:lysylphosphatidylglycerol synthase transmembrane domain-containing protein [Bacillus sp. Marseille-P3661]|uniref:lysylphosphatidylglycerol synthase transmembrane domain-containing protein n=1 Tax=Bacillus sp. Marseille-P3661 TaxID=1936234 RepID=UPI000C85172A|nr:lysylphosphatidylglycerol synthase transmembrane domain-containing protein [Bacillus sp. Marseille-P3661]
MGKTIFRVLIFTSSFVLFVSFILLLVRHLNYQLLVEQSGKLLKSPFLLLVITLCYLLAFILRAIGWKLYLNNTISVRVYVSALFYSLFFNHLFPFKAGEVVRVGVMTHHKEITLDQSIHSVFVMRLLDLCILGFFSAVGAFWLGVYLDFSYAIYSVITFVIGCVILIVLYCLKYSFLQKHFMLIKEIFQSSRGLVIFMLVMLSWVLESVVIYGVVQTSGHQMDLLQATWVNSLTVASSIFQFAPGGFASYESVMSFALVQFKVDWEQAFNLAIITHGYKYLFSYVSGLVAVLLFPIKWSVIKSWFKKKGAAK